MMRSLQLSPLTEIGTDWPKGTGWVRAQDRRSPVEGGLFVEEGSEWETAIHERARNHIP
jgi:hypothetical protein